MYFVLLSSNLMTVFSSYQSTVKKKKSIMVSIKMSSKILV